MVLNNVTSVFFVHSVKGHDVAANLLLKTAGPQIVNVSDAKGRWVKLLVLHRNIFMF